MGDAASLCGNDLVVHSGVARPPVQLTFNIAFVVASQRPSGFIYWWKAAANFMAQQRSHCGDQPIQLAQAHTALAKPVV